MDYLLFWLIICGVVVNSPSPIPSCLSSLYTSIISSSKFIICQSILVGGGVRLIICLPRNICSCFSNVDTDVVLVCGKATSDCDDEDLLKQDLVITNTECNLLDNTISCSLKFVVLINLHRKRSPSLKESWQQSSIVLSNCTKLMKFCIVYNSWHIEHTTVLRIIDSLICP